MSHVTDKCVSYSASGSWFSFKMALLIITILFSLLQSTYSAPHVDRQKAGPCIGMDCLHGILMHGDKALGDGHKHEDEHTADKERERLLAEAPQMKVKVAADELHGVLMHGDEKSGEDHGHDHDKEERLKEIQSMVQHDYAVEDAHRNAFGEEEGKKPAPPLTEEEEGEEDEEGHGKPKSTASWFGKTWSKFASLITGRKWSVGDDNSRITAQQETVAIHDIMEDLKDVGRADKARSHIHHHKNTKHSKDEKEIPPHTEH